MLSWWGNLVWLSECGAQLWKGLGPSSGGASVTARAAPGQLVREVSLTCKSTIRTHLNAGLHRQVHCLPGTLAWTLELLPVCPAWGLLANCTICRYRESKILCHLNSQHQAHEPWATVALLPSVLRPSFTPEKPVSPSSCFYGTCIVVSPLIDCQNPHPTQWLPPRPLLPLAVDTAGVPTPRVNPRCWHQINSRSPHQ